MHGKSDNEGVSIIADFNDRTIPFSNAPAERTSNEKTPRSINEPIYPIAEFNDVTQKVNPSRSNTPGEWKDALSQRIEEGVLPHLSEMERELFVLVVQGRTPKEISSQLGIGTSTIATWKANVFERIRVLFDT